MNKKHLIMSIAIVMIGTIISSMAQTNIITLPREGMLYEFASATFGQSVANTVFTAPAPTETVTKTGVSGATPAGGTGSTTIDWTANYKLTSATTQNITLNDYWTAGQTLVAGSVKMPTGWSFSQPNATSINFSNPQTAPNSQGVTQAFPRPLGTGVTFSG